MFSSTKNQILLAVLSLGYLTVSTAAGFALSADEWKKIDPRLSLLDPKNIKSIQSLYSRWDKRRKEVKGRVQREHQGLSNLATVMDSKTGLPQSGPFYFGAMENMPPQYYQALVYQYNVHIAVEKPLERTALTGRQCGTARNLILIEPYFGLKFDSKWLFKQFSHCAESFWTMVLNDSRFHAKEITAASIKESDLSVTVAFLKNPSFSSTLTDQDKIDILARWTRIDVEFLRIVGSMSSKPYKWEETLTDLLIVNNSYDILNLMGFFGTNFIFESGERILDKVMKSYTGYYGNGFTTHLLRSLTERGDFDWDYAIEKYSKNPFLQDQLERRNRKLQLEQERNAQKQEISSIQAELLRRLEKQEVNRKY